MDERVGFTHAASAIQQPAGQVPDDSAGEAAACRHRDIYIYIYICIYGEFTAVVTIAPRRQRNSIAFRIDGRDVTRVT